MDKGISAVTPWAGNLGEDSPFFLSTCGGNHPRCRRGGSLGWPWRCAPTAKETMVAPIQTVFRGGFSKFVSLAKWVVQSSVCGSVGLAVWTRRFWKSCSSGKHFLRGSGPKPRGQPRWSRTSPPATGRDGIFPGRESVRPSYPL